MTGNNAAGPHSSADDAHDGDPTGRLASLDPALTQNDVVATVATVAVVGVGALLLEAALLPGIAIGVAAVLAPKYLPRMGSAVTPLLRSTVRATYKMGQKAREVAAEAREHMSDIVAEVEAEKDAAPVKTTKTPEPVEAE